MNKFIKGLSYTFKRNLGKTDRVIRTFAAIGVLITWYFGAVTGIIGTVIAVFAIMILGTAATARCGVTYWMDANTMSDQEKITLDAKGIPYE